MATFVHSLRLFSKVAAVSQSKKCDFRKADKVPHTYDRKSFQLDGRIDLDIPFGQKQCLLPYM